MKRVFKIGVITSTFYPQLSKKLESGALKILKSKKTNITSMHVKGSMELPIAAQQMFIHKKCDAIICLGVVIQGETFHFDSVCRTVEQGLTQTQLQFRKPIISGILMTKNKTQALDRLQSNKNHKGEQSSKTCLELLESLQTLKKKS